jgi:hypothetical protein
MLLNLQADPGHGMGKSPEYLCQEYEQFSGTARVLGVALNTGPADLQHIQHPDDVDHHRVLE